MNKLIELKRVMKKEIFTMNKSVVWFVLLLAAVFMFSACNNPAANTLPPEESDPSQVLSESPSEEAKMIRTAEDARELLYEGITIEEVRTLTGKEGTPPDIKSSNPRGWTWDLEDESRIEVYWGLKGANRVTLTKDGDTDVIVGPDYPSLPEGYDSWIEYIKDQHRVSKEEG